MAVLEAVVVWSGSARAKILLCPDFAAVAVALSVVVVQAVQAVRALPRRKVCLGPVRCAVCCVQAEARAVWE
ncbi:hypothetical protein Micbo1qcDRAFT_160553 [Microdochium bolleyi]|uniref:Uncharacterized protein n=1 Tax=Microdochium bolleyi TaxID=196109 RepID=A0A136J6D5_9PEZI|nr:hypothetical protein Micbo1qcDRAFT_160553 [Microdochium bolleyi]